MRFISKQFLSIYLMMNQQLISGRDIKRTYDKINKIVYVLIIFIVVTMATGIIYQNKMRSDTMKYYTDMRVEFDTMRKNNDVLITQMDEIRTKFKNMNLDKYPFDLNSSNIAELKSKMYDILVNIGASRMSISLFHNQVENGYKPINIDGIRTYMYASVLTSTTVNGWKPYDEFIYQNISFKIFDGWFRKSIGNKKDYISFDKEKSSSEDKLLFKMVLLNYDKVESAYIFGIPNNGDVSEYGPFIGTIIFDCDDKSQISASDIEIVHDFADIIGNYMNNIRR